MCIRWYREQMQELTGKNIQVLMEESECAT